MIICEMLVLRKRVVIVMMCQRVSGRINVALHNCICKMQYDALHMSIFLYGSKYAMHDFVMEVKR